jgi:hypothetical protein
MRPDRGMRSGRDAQRDRVRDSVRERNNREYVSYRQRRADADKGRQTPYGRLITKMRLSSGNGEGSEMKVILHKLVQLARAQKNHQCRLHDQPLGEAVSMGCAFQGLAKEPPWSTFIHVHVGHQPRCPSGHESRAGESERRDATDASPLVSATPIRFPIGASFRWRERGADGRHPLDREGESKQDQSIEESTETFDQPRSQRHQG